MGFGGHFGSLGGHFLGTLGIIFGPLGLTFEALGLIFEALGSFRGLGAHFGGQKVDLPKVAYDFGNHFGDFWPLFGRPWAHFWSSGGSF